MPFRSSISKATLLLQSLSLALIPSSLEAQEAARTTELDVPIVDCHVHLYDTRRPKIHWPRPEHGILYKPYLPADYEKAVSKNNVKAAVLVLAGQNLEDNAWNLEVTKHKPCFYQGVVGNLSRAIGKNDFKKLFTELCKDERYVGYRLSGKYETALTESFFKDLKLTEEKGKTVDFLVGGWTLKEVDQVASKLPNLKIIVNHLGGVKLDGKPLPKEWIEDFKKVAKHKNVFCKVSALYGRFAKQPAPKDLAPYKEVLDLAFKCYGEDRIIYGSDWPVTKQTDSYDTVIELTEAYFKDKGKEILEKLFYKNAIKFYGLKGVE